MGQKISCSLLGEFIKEDLSHLGVEYLFCLGYDIYGRKGSHVCCQVGQPKF